MNFTNKNMTKTIQENTISENPKYEELQMDKLPEPVDWIHSSGKKKWQQNMGHYII